MTVQELFQYDRAAQKAIRQFVATLKGTVATIIKSSKERQIEEPNRSLVEIARDEVLGFNTQYLDIAFLAMLEAEVLKQAAQEDLK